MIMRFDLIAHILHTLLMKSLCSRKACLFNHVKDVVLDQVWQKILVGLSERQLGVGVRHCCVHAGGRFSIDDHRPCRKASSMSMSSTRLFGTISKSPACLAFSSSKCLWKEVTAASIDCR